MTDMIQIDWSKHKMWSEKMILAERAVLDAAKTSLGWGAAIEQEVRRRIRVTVAAYAYEIASTPIMDDAEWDRLAQDINPRLGTCHPVIDEFFACHFSPMTGMWIHQHPELDKVRVCYERLNRQDS